MANVSQRPEANPSPRAAGERLDSWKEIAAHFRRNERTVRRWEQTEGLPVHRHLHEKRVSVYAHPSELDAWWSSRGAGLEKPASPDTGWKHERLVWSAALVGVLAIAAVVTWLIAGAGSTAQATVQIKPLTSYPGNEKYPSFSPDGNQVAFSWDGERQNNIDIYVKTIGEEAPRRLTTDPGEELSPAWSPDGRWIAFLRLLSEGKAAVVVIPAAGGEERKVAEVQNPPKLAAFGTHLGWSPSGEWLVVPDKDLPQDAFGLVRIAVANGEKRRLTSPRVRHGDIAAAISPNGRTVAFIRRTSFAASDLFMMALSEDGAPQKERQVTPFGRVATNPAWTPDGRELLFLAGTDRSEAIVWKMAGSGEGRPEPVASLGEDDALLAVSRQGRLAFTRHNNDANVWRIRAGAVNGAPREKAVLISSTRDENYGHYSPDGRQISFESNRSGSRELWKCERDGSHAVQLTSMAGLGACCSSWSPDGRRLIFVSYPEGLAQLYVINASGGAPRRVTHGPHNYSTPGWSRNGQWIYFQSDRGGQSQIWKTPANGGEAVQVTRDGGGWPRSRWTEDIFTTQKAELWRPTSPPCGGLRDQAAKRCKF